jgi:hypothetical protein
LCISNTFLVFTSSNSTLHFSFSSTYFYTIDLNSPVYPSIYFSNAEITLSNLLISVSNVSLTVDACLNVAYSKSSIFCFYSLISNSMLLCLLYTVSLTYSTVFYRFPIDSPSTDY